VGCRPTDWPWEDEWEDLDELPAQLDLYRQVLEQVQQTMMEDAIDFGIPAGQVVVGFTFHQGINFRSARRPGGRFAIDIDLACVFRLYDAFTALLACPSTLPGLGTPPPWSGPYGLSDLNAQTGDREALTPGSTAIPALDDPDRSDVLSFCVRAAMHFILGHEAAHIRLGHVDGWPPGDASERRARELHADHIGGAEACWHIPDMGLEVVARDPQYLWGFAVGVLFALVELDAGRRDDQYTSRLVSTSSHPRGALRAVWASEALTRDDDRYRPLGVRAGEGCRHAYEAWTAAGWDRIEPARPVEIMEVAALLAPGALDRVP